ncbi:MAG: hypothetical protein ACYCQJ_09265 [Nitrososphaerales archaeon]
MSKPHDDPLWRGRPSVGSYILIYGIITLIVILALVTIEYSLSASYRVFPNNIGGILYPLELATATILVILFAIKAIQLAVIWATNRYELMSDGLYVNQGIVNLESSFLSAMAFSDARLIRTWSLRMVKRGLIIVEANDGRRFFLNYVKDPLQVQSLIRSTLAHPTVRTE